MEPAVPVHVAAASAGMTPSMPEAAHGVVIHRGELDRGPSASAPVTMAGVRIHRNGIAHDTADAAQEVVVGEESDPS